MDTAVNRLEYKVQALLEKISKITTTYENQEADLRVEVTMLSVELQSVKRELGDALQRLQDTEVENEVLEEPASVEG